MKQNPPDPEISVIIPAYNEDTIIYSIVERTKATLDKTNQSYEILIIDDGSTDDTAKNAKNAGAKVIQHPYNIGNGAAIKTGIRNARGKILVMLDGDGQHAPEDIPLLLEQTGPYDMVVGARTKESKTSLYRDIANNLYNRLATYVCRQKIEDLTSGFRAIKYSIARDFITLLPNTFSYPTTITLALVRSGYSLRYIPITTQPCSGKSKINPLQDGTRFLLIIFKVTTLYSPMKVFLPISILTFLTGFGYGLFKIIFLNSRYGPTSAMLMIVSVLIFLIGLVSEQIAQMWFNRIESSKENNNTR